MKFNFKKFIIITIITFVIGNLFSFFVMNNMEYYKTLDKPIDVPGIIFPIVWGILYLLMSISYYIISNNTKDNNTKVIYWAQLVVNSLWTLFFFGLKAYLFSFLWIILLVVLVIIMIFKFYKVNKLSGLIQIPYLMWLLFAGYLNLGIYLLNR